jgi:aminomethyltransferase
MRTSIYHEHLESNAKIMDFFGWELPLHYGSQMDEHMCVRKSVGLFDVSHMNILEISGVNSKNFLRYLLANDISKVSLGQAMYSCMLNTSGGIIDDLIVYCLSDELYLCVVNASNTVIDLKWVQKYAKSFEVQADYLRDVSIIALQGPKSEQVLSGLFEGVSDIKPFHFGYSADVMICRTGYTGEDGFELILPSQLSVDLWKKLLNEGARPCGLGARDSLRLEAGMRLYGSDMNETTTPLNVGLDWTVLMDKGRVFIGREALEQQGQEGLSKKLVAVILKGKGVLRAGQIIYDDNIECGLITSGSFSPILNASIGFAYIEGKHKTLRVCIRKRSLPLEIVNGAFIKRGKILV